MCLNYQFSSTDFRIRSSFKQIIKFTRPIKYKYQLLVGNILSDFEMVGFIISTQICLNVTPIICNLRITLS